MSNTKLTKGRKKLLIRSAENMMARLESGKAMACARQAAFEVDDGDYQIQIIATRVQRDFLGYGGECWVGGGLEHKKTS